MHRWAAAVLVAWALACGPGVPYELRVAPGTYNDGSGALGLALLATARDGQGAGPGDDLSGTVESDGQVVEAGFVYPSGARAVAWWWPSLPASPGSSYEVKLGGPAADLSVAATVPSTEPLAAPEPELSTDGAAILFPAVTGASAYRCLLLSGGAIQLDVTSAQPLCDVSALPPGSYSAEILALSADPQALAGASGQRPELPRSFDVASRALGFAVGDGTAVVQARAAGGSILYGGATPGLAFYLSIDDPQLRAWNLEVLGPGIPAGSPLRSTYPAGAVQLVTWTYDVPATSGTYSLVATSGNAAVSTRFTVGTPRALAIPSGVTVQNPASGGCTVSWPPVEGAVAYYVSAWAHVSGNFAAGQWVTSANVSFPPGTFTPATAYDVYVAAADVDPTSSPAARPSQISISENTYLPVTFIAQ